LVIALPPVLNYASPELYEKVVPDVSGKMILQNYQSEFGF